MARSVTFGGQTQYKPGGLTRINAEGMLPVGASPSGVIQLLGEADAGEPHTVIEIDDPTLAKSTFQSGPLADAIRIAFSASGDTRIPGAATRVLAYKTNNSTQASVSLPGDAAVITDTCASGSTTTVVNLTTGGLTVDAMIGRWLATNGYIRRIVDNTASSVTVSPGLPAAFTTGAALILQNQLVLTSKNYGIDANQINVEIDAGTPGYVVTLTQGDTVETSSDIGGTSALSVRYSGGTVAKTGTSQVDTTGLVVTLTSSGTAPSSNEWAGKVLRFANGLQRLILSNTTGALAGGTGDSLAYAAGVVTLVDSAGAFTASDVGKHITIAGATNPGNNGTFIVSEYVGVTSVKFANTSGVSETSSFTYSSTDVIPVITLNSLYALTTTEIAEINSANSGVGMATDVITVTTATVSITGSSGVATGISGTVSPNTADNFSITFSSGQTLRQLVSQINSTTNFTASIPDGVNQDTTLMSTFDFGSAATTVDCRFDAEVLPTTKGNFRRDLQAIVDWINTYSNLVTAARATVGTSEGSEPPAVDPTTSPYPIWPVYLLGGTRGTSSNSDYQAGFDALVQERANHCVPLVVSDSGSVTFASVAAQLAAHVQLARGIGKNEMGGYIGMSGTLTQVLAQAKALNDGDVILFCQKMTFPNVDGNLTLQPEWSAAVAAASMRSGANEIGDPLTFKFIKTTAITQDSSWSPKDRTSVNKLIAGGVMFAEEAPAGIRWVRDITTYIKNDNICYMDGNTRDAVRYLAYDLRQSIEDQFTGLKATPATVGSVRDFVSAKMNYYRETLNIIVNSLDPETQTKTLPGYRNLRVFVEGNVATIRIEIFPVTGIVFELNDITLQLPRITA